MFFMCFKRTTLFYSPFFKSLGKVENTHTHTHTHTLSLSLSLSL